MDNQEVSKEDYELWRSDKVTQAFFGQMRSKLVQVGMHLANGAAPDYAEYKYYAGMYAAYKQIVETQFEDDA